MPKLAKTLGGFKYSANGGINSKVLGQTGVMPSYDRYTHEDCFMGIYKGIKVIFSEARLYKGSQAVFQGMFVLLETAKPICEGHLIITAIEKIWRRKALAGAGKNYRQCQRQRAILTGTVFLRSPTNRTRQHISLTTN